MHVAVFARRSSLCHAAVLAAVLLASTVLQGCASNSDLAGLLNATNSLKLPGTAAGSGTNTQTGSGTATDTAQQSTPSAGGSSPAGVIAPAGPATSTETSAAINSALNTPFAPNLAHSDSPPIEVYSRIVRHSRGCWFGLDGAIEASHVMHADADPTDKGGEVTISIHDRVKGTSSIWGARAFEIALTPSGSGTDITMRNIKLTAENAAAVSSDIEFWVRDQAGCRLRAIQTAGASALPPVPSRRPAQAGETSKRTNRGR